MTLLVAFALVACGEGTSEPEPSAGGTAGAPASGGTSGKGGTGSAGGPAGAGGSAGVAGRAGASNGGSAGGSVGGAAGAAGSAGSALGGSAGSTQTSGGAGIIAGNEAGGAGGSPQAGQGGSASGDAGKGGSSGSGGSSTGGAGASGASTGGAGNGGGGGGDGYAPCPSSGPCVIMPFGDSITEGFPVNGGYRSRLFSIAREDDHEITFVGSATNNGPAMVDGVPFPQNHEGHGGYTIEGSNGIAQFVATSLPNYEPDIILLMIGTNDINGNISVSSAPNRLGALLDSIHSTDPDVLVILAQIVPTRTEGTNQAVRTYNAAFPALVETRVNAGHHLILIDMYNAFTRDANYATALLGDNLHPNDAGYVRMAETWYAVLEPYLN